MAKRIEMNIKESDSSYVVLWPEDGRYTDEQILSDDVKTFWGLEPDAIPSDAFMAIVGVFDKTVNFTVTIDGAPAEGVTIEGFNGTAGSGELVTNSEGKCTGITTDNTINVTAKSPWIDADNVQYNQTLNGIVSNVNIAMISQSSGRLELTESRTLKFSPSRTQIEYCVIGGGAGGGLTGADLSSTTDGGEGVMAMAAGSGGGQLKTGTFNNNGENIVCTVGSGGAFAQKDFHSQWIDIELKGGNGGRSALSGGASVTSSGGFSGEVIDESLSIWVAVSGGSGGSGGGAGVSDGSNINVASGGKNGTNGNNAYYGSVSANGGSGQGTSTTYENTAYCRGCGACGAYIYISHYYGDSQVMSSKSIDFSIAGAQTVGNDGILYGDAGGSVCYYSKLTSSTIVRSGKGSQGVVILKWTV